MKIAIGALAALVTVPEASAFLPSINLQNDVKKMSPLYYIDPSSPQASDENWNPKKTLDTKDNQGKMEEIENFKQALSMMNTASISSMFSGPDDVASEESVIAEVLTELAQTLASENNEASDPLTMDEVVTALKKGSSAAVDLAIDTAELAYIVASSPEFKHEAADILSGNVKGLVKVPALLQMKMRNLDISRVEMMKGAASSIWTSKNKDAGESIEDRLAYFQQVKARIAKQDKDALLVTNNSVLSESKPQGILPSTLNEELEEKEPSDSFASSIANAYVKTATYDEPTMLKARTEDQSEVAPGAEANYGKTITQTKTSEDVVLKAEDSSPILSIDHPEVKDVDGPEGAYVMAQTFAEDMALTNDEMPSMPPVIAKDVIEEVKTAIEEVKAVVSLEDVAVKDQPPAEALVDTVDSEVAPPVIANDVVEEVKAVVSLEDVAVKDQPPAEALVDTGDSEVAPLVIAKDVVEEVKAVVSLEDVAVKDHDPVSLEAFANGDMSPMPPVIAKDVIEQVQPVVSLEDGAVMDQPPAEALVDAGDSEVADPVIANDVVEEEKAVVSLEDVAVKDQPPAEDPISLEASAAFVEDQGFIETAEAAIMNTIEEEAFNEGAEAVIMQSYNEGSFVETTTHTISKPFFGASTNYLDNL
ncbi:predicted protein [Chaetoceros tenuissimus]|uniref:Uncharacterized protein n=1 Tax=Chaetoceros tenuissimus TaxID=426638 RepID=A0AAD3D3Z3_9STRA|nr:predicted protein [Chaetoceros tenuissimus]